MPLVAMSLGNCTCEDWNKHAIDLSDRIVNSSIDFPLGGLPMWDFCPYCGKKLVQAGRPKKVGEWDGKSLLKYNHQELMGIIDQLREKLKILRDDLSARLDTLEGILGIEGE
jgi:hypothetical protein